ncbi:MAG: hypothetical protein GAK43_01198 [Stenotrophomonas maltophilia]|nr:MAG: hypothetical protein GAK43_01198 [Stenotrophomonas maltophilia]
MATLSLEQAERLATDWLGTHHCAFTTAASGAVCVTTTSRHDQRVDLLEGVLSETLTDDLALRAFTKALSEELALTLAGVIQAPRLASLPTRH